eukprot:3681652-Pyramimonas_sp.AAC.1
MSGSATGSRGLLGRPSGRATCRTMATGCGAAGSTRGATRSRVGRQARRSKGLNFIIIQVRLE